MSYELLLLLVGAATIAIVFRPLASTLAGLCVAALYYFLNCSAAPRSGRYTGPVT